MDNDTEHTEDKIALGLWKSFPPICILLGTFGNIMTILILMQRKCRHSSTSIYLTALAISDLLVLWVGVSRLWIKTVFGTDLIDLSPFWCKSQAFLVYTGFQCSSWFLVAVTTERFMAVCFPHKVRNVCSTKNCGVIIAVVTISPMLLNIHWFYGLSIVSYSMTDGTEKLQCDFIDDDGYVKFVEIWDYIDLLLVSLIPSILLTAENASIIFAIFRMKKRLINWSPSNNALSMAGRKVPQMTITLVTVSVVFVVCSTPISIFILKRPFEDELEMTSYDLAVAELWWAVVNLLAYLNTSLNFVLYFLSGSKFRKKVKDFFKRGTTQAASTPQSSTKSVMSLRTM